MLLVTFILMSAPDIFADDNPSAAQRAEKLRAQLRDVQAEEAELQTRVEQLDTDLRPENIEHYFAGTGSTRPEELREQRRRQLQNEKNRALMRLDQLAASRTRLEYAIVNADAEIYQQSAEDPMSKQLNQMLGGHYLNTARLMAVAGALTAIFGILALVAVIRWRRRMGRLELPS
jgi:hypothetical protein